MRIAKNTLDRLLQSKPGNRFISAISGETITVPVRLSNGKSMFSDLNQIDQEKIRVESDHGPVVYIFHPKNHEERRAFLGDEASGFSAAKRILGNQVYGLLCVEDQQVAMYVPEGNSFKEEIIKY